jgi:hypothetical protein
MMASNRIPVLTPQGHLMLAPTDEARSLPGNLRIAVLHERLAASDWGTPEKAPSRRRPQPSFERLIPQEFASRE